MSTTKTGTADIDLTASPSAAIKFLYVHGITVTAGADAAEVSIRTGSVSGAIQDTVKAALGTTVSRAYDPPLYVGPIYVDLIAGTTPRITVQVS